MAATDTVLATSLPDDDDFQILRLKSSYETFGIVAEYLARIAPFSRYDVGNFVGSIQLQIQRGNHLAAVTSNRIVGYLGWLPTTQRAASVWRRGGGILVPLAPGEVSDAIAVTIVAARDRQVLSSLARAGRKALPSVQVYFKREYLDERPARKNIVKNIK